MNTALLQQPPMRFQQILRKSAVALLSATALLTTTTSSFAGASEIKALNAALVGSGDTIGTATTAELVAAVNATLAANPKLKPGVVIGEALNGAGSSAPDIGAALAAKVLADFAATKVTVASDAAKTAGGSKGNPNKIPDFAANLALSQNDAILIAQNAKGAKAGSSAVLGGYATTLADDAARRTFANSVLDPTLKLSGNAQDIAKFLAATVADGALFANVVAGADANAKLAEKLVIGSVAGKPTEAGAIVNEALNINNPTKPGAANLLISKAASLAKTVSAVADIEQIQKVGQQIANRIGLPANDVNRIKLAQAVSVATTLAKAITAKAPVSSSTDTSIRTRNDNKVDELGELAAYMLAALSTSPDFNLVKAGKATNAEKTVIGLLKAITAAAKTKTPGTTGPLLLDVAKYVGGSIGLTVAGLPAVTPDQILVKNAIIAALNNPKLVDPIAKGLKLDAAGSTTNTAAFKAAIADGLDGEPSGQQAGRFENGFDPVNGFGSSLTDPETNYRNP